MAENGSLYAWLTSAVGLDAGRAEALVQKLASEWVADRETLIRCLPQIEKTIPAAAYVAISEAISREATQPPPPPPQPVQTPGMPPPGMPPPEWVEKYYTQQAPSPDALLKASREREQRAAIRREEFKLEVAATRKQLRRWWRPIGLQPDSRWLRAWDLLLLLPALLFTALVTPFEVSFLPLADDVLWRLNRAVDAVLAADAVLLFFVAFREPPQRGGRLVLTLGRIAHRRLRSSSFLVDLVACVPYELLLLLFVSGQGFWPGDDRPAAGGGSGLAAEAEAGPLGLAGRQLGRLLLLLRLLKLSRLLRFGRLLARWEGGRGPFNFLLGRRRSSSAVVPYHVASALALFGGLCLSAHWLACLWGYIGRTGALIHEAEHAAAAAAAASVPPPPSTPSPPTLPLIDGAGLGSSNNGTGSTLGAAGGPGASAELTTLGGGPAGSWLALSGLSASSPPHEIYAVALHTSLCMLVGGSSRLTAATDAESLCLGLMLLCAGLLWGYSIAYACSLAPSAWPQVAADLELSEDVDALARDRGLPPATADRVRAYLVSARQLEAAGRQASLLSRLSARLRGDAAAAASRPYFERVAYLRDRPFGVPVEADFHANVWLALERRLHAPRESIAAAGALTLFELGMGAHKGRLLPPGRCIGESMVVHLACFRDDASDAVALNYTQVAVLSRERLEAILQSGAFPNAGRAVRAAAITLALRRATLLVAARIRDARRTAAASPGLSRDSFAAAAVAVGTPSAHGLLLSALPLRELLEEANAAEARKQKEEELSSSMSSSLVAAAHSPQAGVAAAAASGGEEEKAMQRALEALESRIEHAVEGMVSRLRQERGREEELVRGRRLMHSHHSREGGGGEETTLHPGRLARLRQDVNQTPGALTQGVGPADRSYGPAYSGALPGKRARRNVCQGDAAPAAPTITIEPGQGLPADHQLLSRQPPAPRPPSRACCTTTTFDA